MFGVFRLKCFDGSDCDGICWWGFWVIKVYIVDDYDLVCMGIFRMLLDIVGIKVVGEVVSGEDVLWFICDLEFDVVLMDVKMFGIGGLEVMCKLLW